MADELLGTEAPEVQADTAAAPPAPQGEPVLEGLDGLDLRGLAEGLRPTVEAPPTDAVTDSDEDGDGEADAEPVKDGEPQQPRQQLTAQQWAEVLRDAPQRINEAPGKLRAEAIRLMRAADAAAIEQRTLEAVEARRVEAQRWGEVQAEIARIEQVKREDPESFVEWQDAYPDRHAAYIQAQSDLAEYARSREDPNREAAKVRKASASVVAQLVPYPEIAARLADRNYPLTWDGYAKLTNDVATEIARAEAAPARARQQAAAETATKPKPLLTGGGAGNGEISLASLKAMTPEQVLELTSTPEGAARMERALTAGRK